MWTDKSPADCTADYNPMPVSRRRRRRRGPSGRQRCQIYLRPHYVDSSVGRAVVVDMSQETCGGNTDVTVAIGLQSFPLLESSVIEARQPHPTHPQPHRDPRPDTHLPGPIHLRLWEVELSTSTATSSEPWEFYE